MINIKENIATISIDSDGASLITTALLAHIHNEVSCICPDCVGIDIKKRAEKILDLYFTCYNFSKLGRHTLIKVPTLDDIINKIEESNNKNK